MWRAYITDIHTGLIGQPLDIPNFSWTVTINDSSLSTTKSKAVGKDDVQSITLPWAAVPGHTARERYEAIEPGRKAIALFWTTPEDEDAGRLGTPILWGGIGVRTDGWDSTSFNLTSVYSLLDQRYVVREGQYHDGTSKDSIVFQGMSLRGIASEIGYLCTDAKPGGELPVDWTYRGERHPRQSGEDATIHRRVYEAWNVSNQSGKKLLDDLAVVQGGPDMQFRPYLTADGQHVRLRFEAGSDTEPHLGQQAVRGFSCWPGGGTLENIEVSYLAPTQRIYATGAGEDAATLTALAEDLTQVTGPAHVALSEMQYSDTDVKDLALLQSHARARLEASSRPLMQLSGEIHFDDPSVPAPGMFWPGQLISLDMEGHPSLPDGQYLMRVMEMSGDATDKAKIVFDAQPVAWYEPVTQID